MKIMFKKSPIIRPSCTLHILYHMYGSCRHKTNMTYKLCLTVQALECTDRWYFILHFERLKYNFLLKSSNTFLMTTVRNTYECHSEMIRTRVEQRLRGAMAAA
jgi:hypothetical protein